MYADCVKARKSIRFEQYILKDDEIGQRFIALFTEKARQGVTIRLLLDRVGSRDIYGTQILQDLFDAGGEVLFYNPIKLWNLFAPPTWFPRNHTKTMLIDSEIIHIGSACLASSMANWRDQHARISGLFIEEIAENFSYNWSRAAGQNVALPHSIPANDPAFQYMVARPHLSPSPIYRELLAQINAAHDYIYMATPYFLPPHGLRHALRQAAQRGVDVRIILTAQSDVPLAVHVSRSFFPQLIKDGLRIYNYKGTVFHAKYSLIDDEWATMGSVNLDYLSLLQNREANIMILRPDVVLELKKFFYNDLHNSDEIRQNFWRDIPLPHKIIGYLGRSVKRMM
ncbi:MAG: hypothetical protein KJ667_09325 [Alphaproteobacteria bacterium]|nr:hypothetical protein [Alphaproteobacteria bacterium]